MKFLKWSASLIFGLVLTAFLIVGGLAVAYEMQPPYWSQEAAGWVQAVGSIAAIVAAVMLMRHQTKEAIKLEANADKIAQLRRARTVTVVVTQMCKELETALGHVDRTENRIAENEADRVNIGIDFYKGWLWSKESADEARQRLVQIPIYDLSDNNMIGSIVEMLDRINDFQKLAIKVFDELNEEEITHKAMFDQRRRSESFIMLGTRRSQINSAKNSLNEAFTQFEKTLPIEQ